MSRQVKFNIDDDMVTDKLEIALNFNNFYVNIGTKLSSDISTNSGDPLYHTRWLPGFARVPHYAPSPCHMYTPMP